MLFLLGVEPSALGLHTVYPFDIGTVSTTYLLGYVYLHPSGHVAFTQKVGGGSIVSTGPIYPTLPYN